MQTKAGWSFRSISNSFCFNSSAPPPPGGTSSLFLALDLGPFPLASAWLSKASRSMKCGGQSCVSLKTARFETCIQWLNLCIWSDFTKWTSIQPVRLFVASPTTYFTLTCQQVLYGLRVHQLTWCQLVCHERTWPRGPTVPVKWPIQVSQASLSVWFEHEEAMDTVAQPPWHSHE